MLHRLIPRRSSHLPQAAAAVAAAAAVLAAALLVFWSPPASSAGLVLVTFVEPQRYTDVGRLVADRERALQVLGAHFEGLAAGLPDGQQLRIEVLDVDLAGELYPMRTLEERRVLLGRADFPRIHLRWALAVAGQAPRAGEDRLADMNYLSMLRPAHVLDELFYEKRMIDGWFGARFGSAQP
jgi:hypothetical protein